MRMRVVTVDEFQYLTCLQHGLWGSKSNRFKDWQVGDLLAFKVGSSLTALARVSRKPFVSREQVWDNGLFPHRIALEFVHVMLSGNRIPVLGEIRDTLLSAYDGYYGLGILNQYVMKEDAAGAIAQAILAQPNDLAAVQADLKQYLDSAKRLREAASKQRVKPKRRKQDGKEAKPQLELDDKPVTPKEQDRHSRIQHALVQLGKMTGCKVWVASNDRNRQYNGKSLGEDCLQSLPNLGLSDEATRRISLIDVIWIKHNAPVCAFEVEVSTTVYSGLLRMSDLLAVTPALNMKLFVVAPKERQSKVMSELGRPTFYKTALADFCRFIPAEDLDLLVDKVDGMSGFVPDVIDNVAVSLDDELDSSLR